MSARESTNSEFLPVHAYVANLGATVNTNDSPVPVNRPVPVGRSHDVVFVVRFQK